MNINIRAAVADNLRGMKYGDIEETIMEALQSGEEKTLPGLGFMFEVLWQNSDAILKQNIVNTITSSIK